MLWFWYRLWFDVCLDTAYNYPLALIARPIYSPTHAPKVPKATQALPEQMEYG